MSQLFIFLDDVGAHWLALDRQSRRLVQSGSASALRALSIPVPLRETPAVLVVATEWVLLERVVPPKGAKAQSLPWLIEPHLLRDIESQYCYDREAGEGGRTIALLDQALLDGWMDDLAALDINLCALVPDAWLLRVEAGCSALLQHGERVLMLRDDAVGAALPAALTAEAAAEFGRSRVECWGLEDRLQQPWRQFGELSLHSAVENVQLWLANNWDGDAGILPRKLRQRPKVLNAGALRTAAIAVFTMGLLLVSGWLSLEQLREDHARSQQQYQAQLQQYPQFSGLLAVDLARQLSQVKQRDVDTLDDQLSALSRLFTLLPQHQLRKVALVRDALEVELAAGANVDVLALVNSLESADYRVQWHAAKQTLNVEAPFATR
ncbi:MAG: type II secretion system protein GspL [Pseudomonadales bacterium]